MVILVRKRRVEINMIIFLEFGKSLEVSKGNLETQMYKFLGEYYWNLADLLRYLRGLVNTFMHIGFV